MELLSPAGNLEKLKTAVLFGANAVYCGIGSYSLRAPETSFTLEDLSEGLAFAHARNCKVYLAVNIFPFDNDFDDMANKCRDALSLGIDAFIISDPGLLSLLKKMDNNVIVHLSTQANTTNSESARFWHNQGISRIVLARELSLTQIARIKKNCPGLELEVFIHGAMCMAYSGRCLLSKHFNNRSANLGLCTQPCRWKYYMTEANRDDTQVVHEDDRGTYILNSRDLCMIEHIPALAETGVDSLKIEGRMKTAYYTGAVTRVYRAALNQYYLENGHYRFDSQWLEELKKVSHRPYTTGFFFPEKHEETEYTSNSTYIRNYDFVGKVKECNRSTLRIQARNRFAVGDTIEILDPEKDYIITLKIGSIKNTLTGNEIDEAHNSYDVSVPMVGYEGNIGIDSLVRRKVGNSRS